MTDFSALLDKPLDEFERPKPIPVGSYLMNIGQPKFDKTTGEKQTPYAEFPVQLVEPLPDVDQEALALALNGKTLAEITGMKLTFYLTDGAMFRLKEFLRDHVGVPEGLPASEAIQQAVGRQVVGVVSHVASKRDPSSVYANIDQTAALPA